MRILLIAPPMDLDKEVCYSYLFPLGLGYISSALKKAGYQVDCLNLNHQEGTIKELTCKQLNNKKYDFVGTGGTALVFKVIKEIIKVVKNHKSKPQFILGGDIITSEPKVMFDLLGPDFAVIGEGEEAIIELLKTVEKRRDIKKVKGLAFRDKEGNLVFTAPREPIKDLDVLSYPDFEGFEFDESLKHQRSNTNYVFNMFDYPRVYPILGSRGCPFNCTFCYHYAKYRKRSINAIMEEIRTATKRYKINIINFHDECIATDKERLLELCRKMKEFRKELPWDLKWALQMTVNNVTDELLETIKDSGVGAVSYGFESMSPEVLKSMRKSITPDLIENAFKKTLKANLGIQANFIFGDIAETKESAKQTLDWWKENAKGQIHLLFIEPYPGSEIYKHCVKRGIIKNKIDFITHEMGTFCKKNMTDNMTDKEFNELKKEISKAFQNHVRVARPSSKKRTGKNLYKFTVKCPHCTNVITYKNCNIKTRFQNKWNYGFNVTCRNCHHRFYIVSLIKKLGYKYYSKIRSIRDYQLKKIQHKKPT